MGFDNAVYAGPTGYAGAFGPMPMPAVNGRVRQLIDDASIYILESRLQDHGLDPFCLRDMAGGWQGSDELLDPWIEHTAKSLAHAVVASCAVIDFSAAIIDGGFPEPVRKAVVAATRKALADFDLRGLHAPEILEGTVGANARAIGAALLPFFDRFLVDQNVLFKAVG